LLVYVTSFPNLLPVPPAKITPFIKSPLSLDPIGDDPL
jgi:hypothetical protein